eukprot:3821830-Pyramimonas_sp.AAC.1
MAIGLAMAGQIHPCIVGGDWNMEAQVVRESTSPVHAQLEFAVPRRTACRTASSLSTLDYFGPSTEAMRMLASCSADLSWVFKPHRPVQLRLVAECSKVRYLTCVGGPRPTSRVSGPFLEDS